MKSLGFWIQGNKTIIQCKCLVPGFPPRLVTTRDLFCTLLSRVVFETEFFCSTLCEFEIREKTFLMELGVASNQNRLNSLQVNIPPMRTLWLLNGHAACAFHVCTSRARRGFPLVTHGARQTGLQKEIGAYLGFWSCLWYRTMSIWPRNSESALIKNDCLGRGDMVGR